MTTKCGLLIRLSCGVVQCKIHDEIWFGLVAQCGESPGWILGKCSFPRQKRTHVLIESDSSENSFIIILRTWQKTVMKCKGCGASTSLIQIDHLQNPISVQLWCTVLQLPKLEPAPKMVQACLASFQRNTKNARRVTVDSE